MLQKIERILGLDQPAPGKSAKRPARNSAAAEAGE